MGRGKRRQQTTRKREGFARASELFLPELRDVAQSVEAPSARALLQGGYVRQVGSGLYTLLPLGKRVFRKVEQVIREEMDAIGGQEITMPLLTPKELWDSSGRSQIPELFSVTDRRQAEFLLALSHEETATLHARELKSYRDLPQVWYHFGLKERDEARPRGGLLRLREFVMKDSYSFDADEAGLAESYALHQEAYHRVFARLGLAVYEVESDVGVMGGAGAHEYMAPCVSGEDMIVICSSCQYRANVEIARSQEHVGHEVVEGDHCAACGQSLQLLKAIEVGNIFRLGTKYSAALGATFTAEDGTSKDLVMGSYGIGPARSLAAVCEQALERGRFVWPQAIAPYDVHVLALKGAEDAAGLMAKRLHDRRLEVLLDDRDTRPGDKFHAADRVGIPLRVTVGSRGLKRGVVELERLDTDFKQELSVDIVPEIVAGIASD
jgi:prolyl-tRNA synthetase